MENQYLGMCLGQANDGFQGLSQSLSLHLLAPNETPLKKIINTLNTLSEVFEYRSKKHFTTHQ